MKFLLTINIVLLLTIMPSSTWANNQPCSEKCSNVFKKGDPFMNQHENSSFISANALFALIQSGASVTILDARSAAYDDGKRIPGAFSLNKDSDIKAIEGILPKKNSLIVTYCSNVQCPASNALFKKLKQLGYSNVIELPEGIQGWQEAGFKVE